MIEMLAFAGVWSLAGLLFIWWRIRVYNEQAFLMTQYMDELVSQGLHASKMTDEEMEELNELLMREFPAVMRGKKLERM